MKGNVFLEDTINGMIIGGKIRSNGSVYTSEIGNSQQIRTEIIIEKNESSPIKQRVIQINRKKGELEGKVLSVKNEMQLKAKIFKIKTHKAVKEKNKLESLLKEFYELKKELENIKQLLQFFKEKEQKEITFGRISVSKTIYPGVVIRCTVKQKHMLFDFKDVDYLYSRSVGILVRISRIQIEHNRQLALLHVSEQVQHLLNVVNLIKFVPVYDSIDEFTSRIKIDKNNIQPAAHCSITLKKMDDITIVRFEGEMAELHCANPFEDLEKKIEDKNDSLIIIDCKSNIKLSVEALSSIVEAANSIKKRGGSIMLAAVNYVTKEIFEMLEIEDTFEYVENVEEGIEKYNQNKD